MESSHFDFVIVGGGSAGCALAHRLSADPARRVLVLEAGRVDAWWDVLIHMPAAFSFPLGNRFYDWCYRSEPEAHMANREIHHARGKLLGGSSSINGMIFQRGNPADYDRWAQRKGVEGWSYADCLPYFKRMESCDAGDDAHRGREGPLHLERGLARGALFDAFFDAALQAGYAHTDDVNGYRQEGFARFDRNVRRGMRWSAARAYLHPVRRRSNLEVRCHAFATRILFEGRRAIGVEYRRGRRTERVYADEVICSGGAINSPQLLQVSGVGPAALLREHGIDVVQDLPGVGENLQDHYYVRTFWKCNQPITLNDDMMSLWRQAKIGLQYLLFKRGPLTVSAGYAAAFVRTRPELTRPDAQLYFINFSTAKRGGHLHPFSGFTCSVSQLQVESRGWVRLRDSDPISPPAILYNYLATENDQRMMVEGLKFARRLVNTPPLAGYVVSEEHPGPRVQSDADWLAFCREAGDTVFHPTSTCRMGADERSVVDPRLRVRGLEALRVVDASAMPDLVSAHINACVLMMADKASDIIRGRAPLPAAEV